MIPLVVWKYGSQPQFLLLPVFCLYRGSLYDAGSSLSEPFLSPADLPCRPMVVLQRHLNHKCNANKNRKPNNEEVPRGKTSSDATLNGNARPNTFSCSPTATFPPVKLRSIYLGSFKARQNKKICPRDSYWSPENEGMALRSNAAMHDV
jgi:hypothetical protein